MKQIKDYIIEKYLINNDVKDESARSDDPSTWNTGDILVGIMSYSMVLVKFFKIVRRTAKKFVVVELEDKVVKGNSLQGQCIADPSQEGKTREGRLNKWGTLVIDSYRCKLWDGEPVWFDHLD